MNAVRLNASKDTGVPVAIIAVNAKNVIVSMEYVCELVFSGYIG